MPRYEHVVARGHEVRLDEVCAHPGRQLVRRERVLGPVTRGAAVTDDQRPSLAAGCGTSLMPGIRYEVTVSVFM
jgi:hypothetical protein